MGKELTQQVRLERMLLRVLLILKKENFPADLRARYEEARSLATRNGKLSIESLQTLTDEEVDELVGVVWDVLGLGAGKDAGAPSDR
ncbi:MAG TPA: hypothetical protein VEW48_03150 [Thermoanaerobaculia bacterium]|nr:hypothetical protein [Thermoanaerobaculia bacterium]